MGVLADWQIRRDIGIEPFAEGEKREGKISFGLTSYGYDVRLGYKFRVFSPINTTAIDPKNFDPRALVEIDLSPRTDHEWVEAVFNKEGSPSYTMCRHCHVYEHNPNKEHWLQECLKKQSKQNHLLIPPHSFVLAESFETFKIPRDVLCIVLGKSTYARCGLVVNVTPGEPEWEGKWTVELSNTTPLPLRIYPGEGIMQCVFFRTDGHSEAVLNAVRRLCGQKVQTLVHDDPTRLSKEWGVLEMLFHEDLEKGTCKVSYLDKKGKYQSQEGIRLPKVDDKA